MVTGTFTKPLSQILYLALTYNHTINPRIVALGCQLHLLFGKLTELWKISMLIDLIAKSTINV